MIRWLITTEITGTRRTIEVRLYSSLPLMRAAARRFVAEFGPEGNEVGEAAGICHGVWRERQIGDVWERDEIVAIVRLSETRLTPVIVAHEFAHAAAYVYGLDYSDDRPVAEHMHAGNEEFAHVFGEIHAAAWKIFGARLIEE